METSYSSNADRLKTPHKVFAWLIFLTFVVWSIIDVMMFQEEVFVWEDWDRIRATQYGIFHWRSAIAVLAVWWLIGIVLAVVYYAIASLRVESIVTSRMLGTQFSPNAASRSGLSQPSANRNQDAEYYRALYRDGIITLKELNQKLGSPSANESSSANEEKQKIYDKAVAKMRTAAENDAVSSYMEAMELLASIKGYRGSEGLIVICKEQIMEALKK